MRLHYPVSSGWCSTLRQKQREMYLVTRLPISRKFFYGNCRPLEELARQSFVQYGGKNGRSVGDCLGWNNSRCVVSHVIWRFACYRSTRSRCVSSSAAGFISGILKPNISMVSFANKRPSSSSSRPILSSSNSETRVAETRERINVTDDSGRG